MSVHVHVHVPGSTGTRDHEFRNLEEWKAKVKELWPQAVIRNTGMHLIAQNGKYRDEVGRWSIHTKNGWVHA